MSLFKRLLALLVPVLIFVVAFVGLYAWRARQNPFHRTDLRFKGAWPLQGDAQLGYAGLNGGVSHMEKLGLGLRYDLFTDRDGARVDAPGDEKPEKLDLITVGGSCAYGYGLANPATFTERLGERLDLDVANFSQVGYGTVQSLLMLRRHLDRRPKLVVYGFIEDHLRRNLSPCAPSATPYCLPAPYLDMNATTPSLVPPNMQYFTPEENWRYYREILTTSQPGWRDVLWRMRIDLFQIKTSAQLKPATTKQQEAQALAFLLDEMVQACEQAGAQLVVLFIPYFREVPNPVPQALLDALDERMHFLDLSEAVSAYGNPVALGFPGDGHPNREGHGLMSDALADFISERELLK